MVFTKTPRNGRSGLLLMENYFEIIIFEKLQISPVISGKSLSFPEILSRQIPSKITKNNSQGVIFVIISCQRVISEDFWLFLDFPQYFQHICRRAQNFLNIAIAKKREENPEILAN